MRVGVGFDTRKPVHLVPAGKTGRILMPITPHGRPAGEQWRGEPGVAFACRTGSRPAVRGRATPCRRTVPKTGAPRRIPSHYFILPEAADASGPALLPQTVRSADRAAPRHALQSLPHHLNITQRFWSNFPIMSDSAFPG